MSIILRTSHFLELLEEKKKERKNISSFSYRLSYEKKIKEDEYDRKCFVF